jgi:hypothetical protein
VVVERRGQLTLPVELVVHFSDGSSAKERWDGGRSDGRSWRRFVYEGPAEVTSAQLDPDRKVALDLSRWNDGRLRTADPAPRESLLQSLADWCACLLSMVGL